MNSFLHISQDWYLKIADLIKTADISKDDILLDGEKLSNSTDYKIIVLEIWPEKIDFDKLLLLLSEALDENGTLCLVLPAGFLFSQRDRNNRLNLLSSFHLEGVVTLKRGVFNTVTIPLCLLLLNKKKGNTWFTTASNLDELRLVLNNRKDTINSKRNIYHCDKVDPNNLMPEHYNGEIARVNQVLDQYETKKLNDVAELFVGKSIPQDELVQEKGFQYIRPRNIKDEKLVHSGVYIKNDHLSRYAKYTLLSGDILISKQFGQRKIAQVTEEDCPAIASNGFIVIRPTEIPEQYLYNYLTSTAGKSIFNKQLDSIETGTTIRNLNLSDIKKLRIPIFDNATMFEMTNIDNLDNISLIRLAERLEKRVSEYEMQCLIVSQLQELGWEKEEIRTDNVISVNGDVKYRPDIVLQYNEKAIAIVEIKLRYNLMSELRIQISTALKQYIEVPLVIITNLKKCYLYFTRTGEHKVFNNIPSKGDVIGLLGYSEVNE